MRKQLQSATVLCGLLAASLLAAAPAAAESEGLYLDVRGGVTFVEDADNVANNGSAVETSYDPGYSAAGAVGYDFGDFRIEGEVSYREAGVDEVEDGTSSFSADGEVYAIAGMVNGYYDLDLGSSWKPYLGGGLGGAVVGFDNLETDAFGDLADDEDFVFAFQFAAGVGYEFTDNLALYGGYRFFGTTEPELETNDGNNTEFDSELFSHNIEVGLRYTF